MAEETLGKAVKQLKQNRTLAKSALTKQANYLSKDAGNMAKRVLQEEFNKLSSLSRQVSNANEDYRTGLQADLEAGKEECDRRLDEVRKEVQAEIWPRYSKKEINPTFEQAEAACERS